MRMEIGDMAIYNSHGKKTANAYTYGGNRIVGSVYDANGDTMRIIDSDIYSDPLIETYFTLSVFPMQAFDVFNGKMFQFKAGGSNNIENEMDVIDISTMTKISTSVSVESGHGNSASFSGEYYVSGDAFPLLYVSHGDNPPRVHVNRVATNSAQCVRTYKFPLEYTGYYSEAAIDSDNTIIYMIGSLKNEIYEDDGMNKTIISKWDYSNVTQNDDGTYTPEFISLIETDFFAIHQGLTLHNGYVWIISWDYNKQSNYIIVLNPENGTVIQIIDLNISSECEGIAFISANEAIVGVQGGEYKKVTFASN